MTCVSSGSSQLCCSVCWLKTSKILLQCCMFCSNTKNAAFRSQILITQGTKMVESWWQWVTFGLKDAARKLESLRKQSASIRNNSTIPYCSLAVFLNNRIQAHWQTIPKMWFSMTGGNIWYIGLWSWMKHGLNDKHCTNLWYMCIEIHSVFWWLIVDFNICNHPS